MNALVNYIVDHPGWRKELVEKPFCLTIKDDGPYTIFSYSQIDSDFSLPEVQVARGIILKIKEEHLPGDDLQPMRVVCDIEIMLHRFNKFFNYAEVLAAKIDWSTARVTEKCDGCLDENTLIETPEGKRTIRNLCEVHYRGLVKSKNLDTGEVEWDEVEADSIQENNDDWFEITLENGATIKITENHKIWLPDLQCWRRVEELEGTEKVDVI
jgi:hypothetical protein